MSGNPLLTAREMWVLYRRINDPRITRREGAVTFRELGEELGVCTKRAQQIERKAIFKLQCMEKK